MVVELEQGGSIELRKLGASQVVVELQSLQRNSISRTCPKCGAQPGRLCTSRTGRAGGALHSARCGQVPTEVLTCTDAKAVLEALRTLVEAIEAETLP